MKIVNELECTMKTNTDEVTYKPELTLYNCGFDHDPESIVRSQWQSKSKSKTFLIYRWLVAAFVIAAIIVSMYQNPRDLQAGKYFIYLTHWALSLNVIVGVFGAILVTIWHFNADFQENLLKNRRMPIAFKIYWALHNIALVIAFVVTIVYWTKLHRADKHPLNASNIFEHAMNSAIMFFDILITAYPLRLYHVIQPISFGIAYGIFSYIHFLCGGRNIEGEPFIYSVMNWQHPEKALSTIIGSLALATVVHFVLFYVYKLRVFVQRRYFTESTDSKQTNYPENSI